jgi:hypothetical protein
MSRQHLREHTFSELTIATTIYGAKSMTEIPVMFWHGVHGGFPNYR